MPEFFHATLRMLGKWEQATSVPTVGGKSNRGGWLVSYLVGELRVPVTASLASGKADYDSSVL